MRRSEVLAWAEKGMDSGTMQSFYIGVMDAARGTFNPENCPEERDENDTLYCEGGREGLRMLDDEPGTWVSS